MLLDGDGGELAVAAAEHATQEYGSLALITSMIDGFFRSVDLLEGSSPT